MNISELIPLIVAGGALLTWVSIGLYDAVKQHKQLKQEEQLKKRY